MKAEVIASGTELLLGQITDANTAFIANQLAILGIDLYYASIVGDNYERFLGVLKQAWQRSDLVIITGGLGPTKGDITREVIAGLMGEKMEVDPGLKQHLTAHFARTGIEMPENNLKQATLIPSAEAIPNPLGTAPGWWLDKNGKVIISLPGPPGEMQPMWQAEIHGRLEKKGGAVIVSRILKTWGLSESRIDQLVSAYTGNANPTLALYAKSDGIQLRITAKAAEKGKALELIHERENSLRDMLKDYIWGTDSDTLEELISSKMLDRGLTLATAESISGGNLSSAFAGSPRWANFFAGSIVAINEKTRVSLGLSGGHKSDRPGVDTAAKMASYARDRFEADIGIGIDGSLDTPAISNRIEAYVAIVFKNGLSSVSQSYNWRPQQIGRRIVTHALFHLVKSLQSI